MSRGPQSFTQSDITKAVKGSVRAGMKVGRVEIKDGKITVFAGEATSTEEAAPDLDRELAEFEARNGQG
jgi:hypothetical protein